MQTRPPNIPMMLFQVHWQNRANLDETEFVAQGEFDDAEKVLEWAREVIERRAAEMPDGWCPLVATEDWPGFTRAVHPTGR